MSENTEKYEIDTQTGIIAWFTRNHVAANLLMVFIVIGGLATAFSLKKQMFPQFQINTITINAAYPGAAPADVEENITQRIEDVLEGIQGLERVVTISRRNSFFAYIVVEDHYDVQDVLDEIKVQVDGIARFPEGMERPIITAQKYTQEVAYLSLSGDISDKELKDLGEEVYSDLQLIPQVNTSEFFGGLNYEISIEVSKDKLREYNLSFQDIANAVRRHSTNQSAGQIKAADGIITLRAESQAYRGNEFEKIPVLTQADGSQVFVSDIALVTDGFEEGILYSRHNGKNARNFFVGASEEQSITDIAKVVKEFVDEKNKTLPEGVELSVWVDLTYYLEGRLNMMLKNMVFGGILVFLMLALFLKIRLAFWVMLGLPIAFFGALLFMPAPWIDVTINVTSLFGFIMVLGIVVDDAIVIGESIGTEIEERGHSIDNVIRGAKRVAMPATFGVLTTIAAFSPMVLATGPDAAISQSIGWVVVLCLLFSLVESKLILPAHLATMKDRPENPNNPLQRLRSSVDKGMRRLINKQYVPRLESAIEFRYFIIAIFIVIVMVSIGLFNGGVIRSVGAPKIPHDFPKINLEMNSSAHESQTREAVHLLERLIEDVEVELENEFGQRMIEQLFVRIENRTEAEITARLVAPELRPIDTFALADRWREALPPLPGKKLLTINDRIFSNNREDGDVAFRFSAQTYPELERAVSKLKSQLEAIDGVDDVNDSRDENVKEVQFELYPHAYSLGLTVADVASQMAFSLYGLEAQRILRNNEEIKVMVRYPLSQRNSVGDVENLLIRTPSGAEVTLGSIAEVKLVDALTQIRREGGRRTITVWANVNKEKISTFEVYQELRNNILPEVRATVPSFSMVVSGRFKDELESNQNQVRDLVITLMVIFILLAIPLKSYFQPLIIMSVIPFGVIGAMFGHLILGMDMSSLSYFGVIAAAGVVINDSLVMVDYINKARLSGISIEKAVVYAGSRRFRAIILTSLTTFIGLIPIILETSLQAKIVIPMAVSLAFGVLFATIVTLILIPCLYVVGSDINHLIAKRRGSSTPKNALPIQSK